LAYLKGKPLYRIVLTIVACRTLQAIRKDLAYLNAFYSQPQKALYDEIRCAYRVTGSEGGE